jgi:hypothetical protein
VVGQVDDEAVEPVRDRRAGRASRRVVGPEHEVVDEELRAPSEEVCQRGAPFIGLESVLLVDPNPRQPLTSPRQARRCAALAPSPPRAARAALPATLHVFRSCGQSSFFSLGVAAFILVLVVISQPGHGPF